MSDDYTFLGIDVDDAKDMQLLPDGTEALLRVKEATVDAEKMYAQLTCEVVQATGCDVDLAFVRDIRHPLFYPKADDDAKKTNNKKVMLKHFKEATKQAQLPQTPDEFVGLEFWAILGVETDTTGKYGDKNNVKRYVGQA